MLRRRFSSGLRMARLTIRIDLSENAAFDPGKARLLELVDHTGSMRRRRPRRISTTLVLVFVSMACATIHALGGEPAVAISGRVAHPEYLMERDLRALPPITIHSAFLTDRGQETGVYVGAPLWTVLAGASPIDDPGKNSRLRHTFLVTGRDGYSVALSDGEIDPHCENKPVILAYIKDGKPLDGIRLIVPGDRRGGRAVKDIVAIAVR